MKKFKLLFVVATALLLGSCKKDKSLDVQMPEASIVSKSAAEQVKYAEVNLKKIANTVGKLTQNPEFVNFVHTEVAKKRDGQFEVLITRLLKSPVWGPQLNTKELNEGLEAFKNLQGTDFYPQIYIPKMQNDEDNHSTNFTATNNTTASDDVKVVVFGGELAGVAEDAPHPSYSVNDAGVLIPFQSIAEPYANEHEVWVFSINEVITTNGLMQAPTDGDCGPNNSNYPECTYGGGGGSGGGGGGNTTGVDYDSETASRQVHPDMNTNSPVNCKIQNMTVKYHKESWLAGGSEIAIRSALNTINGHLLGNPNDVFEDYFAISSGTNDYRGALIKWFSRKQINNNTEVNVDFPLVLGWPTNISNINRGPVYFDYEIFERDQWPTSLQVMRRKENEFWFYNFGTKETGYISHSYRSADIFYDMYRLTNYTSLVTPNPGSTIYLAPPSYSNGANATAFYNGTSRDGIQNSITFNVIGY